MMKRKGKLLNEEKLNERETVNKIITPHLENEFGYPSVKSKNFKEERYIVKKGGEKGRYDGLYFDWNNRVALLEAKEHKSGIGKDDIDQAKDYALGPSFEPLPPPILIVSDGEKYFWYQRIKESGAWDYKEIPEMHWSQARKIASSPEQKALLDIKTLIKQFIKIKDELFSDLKEKVFDSKSDTWTLNKLSGRERKALEEILKIREVYLGEKPSQENQEKQIEAATGSVALSYTMKICFHKMLNDLEGLEDQESLLVAMASKSYKYGKLLKSPPYDLISPSDNCLDKIQDRLRLFDSKNAILYDSTHSNPIGMLYETLIDEVQVETLGSVFTPDNIVNFMCDLAEKQFNGFKSKKILEPACGSGHFVREIYRRYVNSILKSSPAKNGTAKLEAHKEALSNIRAIDIDSFSCQATLFAIFLEQARDGIEIIRALAEVRGKWFADESVVNGDTLKPKTLFNDVELKEFNPDLVIGNPPYGVEVRDKDILDHYDLGDNDSYGFFIANALERLSEGGNLIFILGSTFLTIRRHYKIRKKIFDQSKIKQVIQLHRNTFPKRDIFPCILHLEKCSSEKDRDNNTYHFYDTWPIHPRNQAKELEKAFNIIKGQESLSVLPKALFSHYEINQWLPLKRDAMPIFGGSPSLFLYSANDKIDNKVSKISFDYKPLKKELSGIEVKTKKGIVELVPLNQIADVKVGLQTGNNKIYVKKCKDIAGGPLKGGYDNIDRNLIVKDTFLNKLTEIERTELIENGVSVTDYSKDKYFVPYDKGVEQKTEIGELNDFWTPVNYWINWSKKSVTELQKSSKARFQNSQYYFRNGITYSYTGLYSPTFRLNYKGVFDVGGSTIFPIDDKIVYYLLGILNSTVIKYITKVIIENSPNTQVGTIEQIPIPIVSESKMGQIESITKKIIDALKKKNRKNADKLKMELDKKVNSIFCLDKYDKDEIRTWFLRRYPHFGEDITKQEIQKQK